MIVKQDGVECYCLPDCAYCSADEQKRNPLGIDDCPIGCDECTDCEYSQWVYDGKLKRCPNCVAKMEECENE